MRRVWMCGLLHAITFVLTLSDVIFAKSWKFDCAIGEKKDADGCALLSDEDIVESIQWLLHPPSARTVCNNLVTIQGITTCNDSLTGKCSMWSILNSDTCNMGSLQYEIYWGQFCNITVFHFTKITKDLQCQQLEILKNHPNISIVQNDVWDGSCFSCFHRIISSPLLQLQHPNILKLQQMGGITYSGYGIEFTLLSNLFLHAPRFLNAIDQISLSISMSPGTLRDGVGREDQHGWNMWATKEFLSGYVSIASSNSSGTPADEPRQFSSFLIPAGIDPSTPHFHHTFIRLPIMGRNESTLMPSNVSPQKQRPTMSGGLHKGGPGDHRSSGVGGGSLESFSRGPRSPLSLDHVRGEVPSFCRSPQEVEDEKMQQWIRSEMLLCTGFRGSGFL